MRIDIPYQNYNFVTKFRFKTQNNDWDQTESEKFQFVLNSIHLKITNLFKVQQR
jgi:hypothetical protein